ncbi:hypothetical protein FOMG_18825 [Fusarium oxysporum f. sp. melonis 26406]|uniref:Uncharacterized protein n=1 Tax=Fusarium oxysporum f. sp. melonis 26406 TaxID=1089452 RepID=W9YY08_FUSOX|nr:hypothetical protein FOMG_18825 [Fusarium oxysporum f. sp. melonis 26406]
MVVSPATPSRRLLLVKLLLRKLTLPTFSRSSPLRSSPPLRRVSASSKACPMPRRRLTLSGPFSQSLSSRSSPLLVFCSAVCLALLASFSVPS